METISFIIQILIVVLLLYLIQKCNQLMKKCDKASEGERIKTYSEPKPPPPDDPPKPV